MTATAALPTSAPQPYVVADSDRLWRGTNLGWIGAAVVVHGALLAAITLAPAAAPLQPPAPLMVSILPPAPSAPTPPAPATPTAKSEPKPLVKPAPAKPKPAPAPAMPAPSPIAAAPQPSTPATPAAPAAAAPAAPSAPAGNPAPVSAPRFDADYLSNPAPAYPPLSRRMGEQGKVMLRAHVLPNGSADEVVVKTTSGSSRLDNAALDAVRKWKFVPARQGSELVAAWVQIPITFSLEN
ncbi:periplasmic protein TonB [Oryzomicrobium terrae]|uniref:Periplasmic protein TonB n=1 Tax=Oryzomicrobium terrae TaxID=1735038 RepID=A0A5C1E628_9RHOO|nr:energy transducer TonB [Oryzomicrobium terrae]QEL64323.1 periplasmic protein TonB [Oryzomicrobium terrae]